MVISPETDSTRGRGGAAGSGGWQRPLLAPTPWPDRRRPLARRWGALQTLPENLEKSTARIHAENCGQSPAILLLRYRGRFKALPSTLGVHGMPTLFQAKDGATCWYESGVVKSILSVGTSSLPGADVKRGFFDPQLVWLSWISSNW